MPTEVVDVMRGAPNKLYIEGEFRDASGGAKFGTFNPATEELITEVSSAGVEDVNDAVAGARKAFESGDWREMSARARGRILWRIGELLRDNVEEVAILETIDNGKPIFESRYVDIPMVSEGAYTYGNYRITPPGDLDHTLLGR